MKEGRRSRLARNFKFVQGRQVVLPKLSVPTELEVADSESDISFGIRGIG